MSQNLDVVKSPWSNVPWSNETVVIGDPIRISGIFSLSDKQHVRVFGTLESR